MNKNTQSHKPGKQEVTVTMPRTKSLQLLIDGTPRNCRHSFGEGHLASVTGKKREIRGTGRFGISEERLWDYVYLVYMARFW